MPFLSQTSFIPHSYDEMCEGVLPSSPSAEAYAAWVKKFERSEGIETFRISYQSDDFRVQGFRMQPKETQTGKHPLLIFNRGGRRRYGMVNVLTMNNLLVPFAQGGYVVLTSQYRGVDGGEGEDGFGGPEVMDIVHLLNLGKQLPEWDGKNAYLFGWSRGGMMTLLALKHGAKVNAAAIGAPLIDLTFTTGEHPKDEAWLLRAMPEYAEKGFKALEERSAPYWLPKLRNTPLLMMHGDADVDVSHLHSRHLAAKLREKKHPHKHVEFPGGNHYLNPQRDEVLREVKQWFAQYRK